MGRVCNSCENRSRTRALAIGQTFYLCALFFEAIQGLIDALVAGAAREHAEVTRAHRVEAARLIGIARDLGGKLVDLIQGRAVAFEANTKDGTKVRVPFLGEHESAADALGKVDAGAQASGGHRAQGVRDG